MKVFIATPMYGGVTGSYAKSMFHAGLDCKEHGIEVDLRIIRNSCFVDLARSILVKQFLETDCTHMLFIDSDIGFEPHAVAGLVEAGLPLCGGVYPKRETKKHFTATVYEPLEQKGPWLRVKRFATGFMCIERRVLEEMSKRAPICAIRKNGDVPLVFRTSREGKFIAEDYCFCDDYNKLYEEGVFDQPIWVYPDITFDHDGYLGNLHESLINEAPDAPISDGLHNADR
jgi:hypothetical protein